MEEYRDSAYWNRKYGSGLNIDNREIGRRLTRLSNKLGVEIRDEPNSTFMIPAQQYNESVARLLFFGITENTRST